MYFFFMISGIVDILLVLDVPQPSGTDYISLGLAFLVEGLLFANHLHGRDVLDVKIHVLLVYVILLTVIVIFMEVRFQRSVILDLSRSFLTMLQGSWFCAVGIILYGHGKNSKAWDVKSPEAVMQATIYFSWHCAVIFLILVFITVAMSRCYRTQDGNTKISEFSMTALDTTGKQVSYRMLTTHEDEDSDLEYERPANKHSTTS